MADTVLPEADFAFTSTATPSVTWKVARFHLHEALSEPYEAVIEVAEEGFSNLATLLGRTAELTITRGTLVRNVGGIVRAAEDLGSTPTRHHVRLHLVPALWVLSQRVDSRIFQDLNAVEIVKEVLKAANLYQSEGHLVDADLKLSDYPKRECCVQYNECDLAFIMRLLEDEGITFYFRHTGAEETLVLASDAPSDPFQTVVPTLNNQPVTVMGAGGATHDAETARHLRQQVRMQPTGVTLRDWDFTRPFDPKAASPGREIAMTRTQPGTPGDRTVYTYPAPGTLYDYDSGAHYYHSDDLARRTGIRREEHAWQEATSHGVGVVTGFMPGLRVTFTNEDGMPVGPMVLTAVDHTGHVAEGPNAVHPPTGDDRYANTFEMIPVDAVHRPVRHTPRPSIRGPQTATVMARPNSTEEVCVDYYGRVLLRFHWERPERRSESQASKQASAWVRVSQPWAGAGWGVVFNPRVGMEVVVQFLEGNPDRPLVTGCVYNLHNPPPPADELVARRTRSTVRTNSSPGGGGFNELYFEDQKGHEQIYLHAQRDLDEVVLHNHTERVTRNETITVGGNQSVSVGGNQTVHVTGVQNVTVDGSGGSAGNHGTLKVTGDITMEATNEIMIKAPTKITLSCGSSKLEMVPGKVTLTSGAGATLTLDGADVKVEGTNIKSTASAGNDVNGTITTIKGVAKTNVDGSIIEVAGDVLVSIKAALVTIN